MKKYLIFLSLLLTNLYFSQSISPYEELINGVKVIYYPVENDVVVIKNILKGGVQKYSEKDAGIEDFALTALSECGAGRKPKKEIKDKLQSLNARMYGMAGSGYSSFTLDFINSDFNEVWPLYTDALLKPDFNTDDFERMKNLKILQIDDTQASPEQSIMDFARQNVFAGTSEKISVTGTKKTIEKLTPKQVQTYWQSHFNRNNVMIVVVGSITPEMKNSIKTLISKIPDGKKAVYNSEKINTDKSRFYQNNRESATNYINGYINAPEGKSADRKAFIAASWLFERDFNALINEENGLSYYPGCEIRHGFINHAALVVSSIDPAKVMELTHQLIDDRLKNGFTADQLRTIPYRGANILYLVNSYGNSAVAERLAEYELFNGGFRSFPEYYQNLKSVNLQDVNRVFRKYFRNIQWVYEGKPGLVSEKDFLKN